MANPIRPQRPSDPLGTPTGVTEQVSGAGTRTIAGWWILPAAMLGLSIWIALFAALF